MKADPISTLVTRKADAEGWSLGYVAKRAGITPAALWRIMHGHVAVPRGPTVNRLATVLGLETEVVRKAVEIQNKLRCEH